MKVRILGYTKSVRSSSSAVAW